MKTDSLEIELNPFNNGKHVQFLLIAKKGPFTPIWDYMHQQQVANTWDSTLQDTTIFCYKCNQIIANSNSHCLIFSLKSLRDHSYSYSETIYLQSKNK